MPAWSHRPHFLTSATTKSPTMHCSPAAREAEEEAVAAELALARTLRREQRRRRAHCGPLCAALHQGPLALSIIEYLDVGADIVALCFRVSEGIADCVEPVVGQLLQRVGARAMKRIPLGMIGTLRRLYATRNRVVRPGEELALKLGRQAAAHGGGFQLPDRYAVGDGVGIVVDINDDDGDSDKHQLATEHADVVHHVCSAREYLAEAGAGRNTTKFGHVSDYDAPFKLSFCRPLAAAGRGRQRAWRILGDDCPEVLLVCTVDEYMDVMSIIGETIYGQLEAGAKDLHLAHVLQRAWYEDNDAVAGSWRTDKLCGADTDKLYHLVYNLVRIATCTPDWSDARLGWRLRDKGKTREKTEDLLGTVYGDDDDKLLPLGAAWRRGYKLMRVRWLNRRSRPQGTHCFFELECLFGLDYRAGADFLELDWRWTELAAFRRNCGVPESEWGSSVAELRKRKYEADTDASDRTAEAEHLQAIQELHDDADMNLLWSTGFLWGVLDFKATGLGEDGARAVARIDHDHVDPGYRRRRKAGE